MSAFDGACWTDFAVALTCTRSCLGDLAFEADGSFTTAGSAAFEHFLVMNKPWTKYLEN